MHVLDNVLSPSSADAKPNPSLATQVPALSTAASYNISQAPFTTFLPNSINTEKPTQATVSNKVGSGNGATTTGSSSASSTGAGKSGVGRVQVVRGWNWAVFGSMIGAGMIGAVAVLV